ncbi:hypothetical protein [Brevibacterium sp. CT2-23B]|uniref:hypothetical protein n=1 Tax=Brevibacterium sp. CT2-23B TaxID=2729630 RepID=UPI001551E727|nr:hypothetical protein [Brevibacterium sp. CT2-23B]
MESFTLLDLPSTGAPMTGKPVGPARMDKRFTGDISGRATTLSTYALDPSIDIGTDRNDESFSIIPSSGTGDLGGGERRDKPELYPDP